MAHLELGLEKELVENQTSYPFLFTLFLLTRTHWIKNKEHFLQVLHFSQSSDGWSDWGCSSGWVGPSTSGDSNTAIFGATFPDTNSWALHVFLQFRNRTYLNFISGNINVLPNIPVFQWETALNRKSILQCILHPIKVLRKVYNSDGSFISVCVSDLHLTYHNYTSTVIIILYTLVPKIYMSTD